MRHPVKFAVDAVEVVVEARSQTGDCYFFEGCVIVTAHTEISRSLHVGCVGCPGLGEEVVKEGRFLAALERNS